MSRRLVLMVLGAVLLSVAAGLGLVVFIASFGSPVLWAQRQLAGLAVRGGPEVVLEVDVDAMRRHAHERLRRDVVSLLRGERLRFTTQLTDAGIEISPQPGDRQSVIGRLRSQYGDTIEITPVEDALRVAFTGTGLGDQASRAAVLSRDVIENRLFDLGMRVVVTIQSREAGARLLVQMARSDDPNRLTEFATKPGELTFRLVDVSMSPEKAMASAPPPNSELLHNRKESGGQPYLVDKRVLVSGADLTDAQPGYDSRTNEPIVSFRFSTAGARKFAQVTTENVGLPFAIVVDGEVVSAPVIREPILGGSGQISGNFTVQAASELAAVLRHGQLPAPLKVLEVRRAKAQ